MKKKEHQIKYLTVEPQAVCVEGHLYRHYQQSHQYFARLHVSHRRYRIWTNHLKPNWFFEQDILKWPLGIHFLTKEPHCFAIVSSEATQAVEDSKTNLHLFNTLVE